MLFQISSVCNRAVCER